MTKFREELLTRMIHIYGFEHEITKNFATVCESFPDDYCHDFGLEQIVETHEANPEE